MAKTRIGLDIGATAVRAAEVSVNGSAALVRAAQVPLEPKAVENGEIRNPEAVAEELIELGLLSYCRPSLDHKKRSPGKG